MTMELAHLLDGAHTISQKARAPVDDREKPLHGVRNDHPTLRSRANPRTLPPPVIRITLPAIPSLMMMNHNSVPSSVLRRGDRAHLAVPICGLGVSCLRPPPSSGW